MCNWTVPHTSTSRRLTTWLATWMWIIRDLRNGGLLSLLAHRSRRMLRRRRKPTRRTRDPSCFLPLAVLCLAGVFCDYRFLHMRYPIDFRIIRKPQRLWKNCLTAPCPQQLRKTQPRSSSLRLLRAVSRISSANYPTPRPCRLYNCLTATHIYMIELVSDTNVEGVTTWTPESLCGLARKHGYLYQHAITKGH